MNKKTVLIAIFGLLTAIFSMLPLLAVRYFAGDTWHGIVPIGYVYDNEFYMTRMVKGTYSFPFGNNPFFIEHLKMSNPALSAADYLASIPLKAGLSMFETLLFNSVLYNLIFIFLIFVFFRQMGVRDNWIFFMTGAVYLTSYGMMMRPVVLQTVFPFLAFFFYGLIVWISDHSFKKSIVLALSLSGTLYAYTYTWQVAFASMGLMFIWLLKERQWQKIKSVPVVIAITLVLSLPAILELYGILSNSLFPTLLENVGSLKTHIPSKVSFMLMRWPITSALMWFVLKQYTSLKNDPDFKFIYPAIGAIGCGIFIVLASPLIIGRDGAIGDHLSRELYFWLATSVSMAAYLLFKRSDIYNLSLLRKVIIIFLLLLNAAPVIRQYSRSIQQPFQTTQDRVVAAQAFYAPLIWLDAYDRSPRVVWAEGPISAYIPIFSKHFSLGLPDYAYQYWMSKDEMRERYLVVGYFDDIKTLTEGTTVPLGLSYFRRYEDLKIKASLCRIFMPVMLNGCVPKSKDMTFSQIKAQENDELKAMLDQFKNGVKPYINELLRKYKVAYVITDKSAVGNFDLRKLRNPENIYDDGRFAIYKIK